MAQFGEKGVSEMSIPRLSQETLAAMVGTTRSRISFFMNRFRKRGFIHYAIGDNLRVHSSLLNVVLQDNDGITVNPKRRNSAFSEQRTAGRARQPGRTKIGPRGRLCLALQRRK